MKNGLYGDQLKVFTVGEIIFVNRFYSTVSHQEVNGNGHRILIMNVQQEQYLNHYRGFELTSNIKKANIYGDFPSNLYIADYKSILERGIANTKEAILRVDDLVRCNSLDLSPSGSYKGTVTKEFMEFAKKAYWNYCLGDEDLNFKMVWPSFGGDKSED